ncbi:MAG TPA: hypothetical protein VG713_11690, partial [Pirellulales bacterium]|nr:hypothetical protein [Pirellulales bacterium]
VHPQAIAGQNGQGRPFTIKTVNTALMQSKTQLTNLKSKLAKDEQLYTQLETKLAAMNTSVNRNAKQQQAHAAAIGKLQSQLQNDKQKIDQLRTMLPALQNQLDALPTMAKVANELDGHAAIEFRVLYQIDKRSIVLFATSNAPIDEPQPNP